MNRLAIVLMISLSLPMLVAAYGCAGVTPGHYLALSTPPSVADLASNVRLARQNQQRFDEVYKDPDAYWERDRNLALWNLPLIPVPNECLRPGSETTAECIRYGARLRELPVFVANQTEKFVAPVSSAIVPFVLRYPYQ